MSFWVDIHAHLDDPKFAGDIDEVIRRAKEAKVEIILSNATSLESVVRTLDIAERFPGVYAALGIHPQEVKDVLPDFSRLADYLQHPKVVAIGEIGLDYYWDRNYIENQKRAFLIQIELARAYGLPIIVHSRESEQDMLSILKEHAQDIPVIWHCFSGGWEIVQALLPFRVAFSFGGVLTFPKAHRLREVVLSIPRERLFLETDAPYLAPQKKRGKRNEPAFLVYTATFLSELLGVSVEELQNLLINNFFAFFDQRNFLEKFGEL
ncbi:MAG: TatD family hydrolase [Candidatus Atribacteria bacterium]|nr:TatD family hydrolase [Candidatus Atribacteria bacterium]MCD6350272.1 TatD family hydrolase [Candidatus Atribacteria bacterium]